MNLKAISACTWKPQKPLRPQDDACKKLVLEEAACALAPASDGTFRMIVSDKPLPASREVHLPTRPLAQVCTEKHRVPEGVQADVDVVVGRLFRH